MISQHKRYLRPLGVFVLLALIVFTAFWVRSQGIERIPEGQFTETDAYLFYRQAKTVSEYGRLPERDMNRWLPDGRDLSQTLNLYPYTIGYAHKFITLFFPQISIYQVMRIAPVIFFVIGLGVVCIFLYCTYGYSFMFVVGMLLAMLPGAVERSAAGFSDRDSWSFFLGVVAVTTYLWQARTSVVHWRFCFAALSGFFVLLGALSWEGFGVFILVILSVEIWEFLTSEREQHLGVYLVWILMFIPLLFLISPAYRSGYGFSKDLAAFVCIPPLVLLWLRCLRYLLTRSFPFSKRLQPHTRTVAFLITLTTLLLGSIYVFSQHATFTLSSIPFSQGQLMQTVSELKAPDYRFWDFRYGGVLLLSCLGLIVSCLWLWGRTSVALIFPICLFLLTTFFKERLWGLFAVRQNLTLLLISLALVTAAGLYVAWRRKEKAENEQCYVAFITWFFLWVTLTNEAKRYDFFIALSLTFFAAYFVRIALAFITEIVKDTTSRVPFLPHILKISVPIVLLTVLLFIDLTGKMEVLAKRGVHAAKGMRSVVPGRTPMEKVYRWMKTELTENTVVGASWHYGSQLNALGNVKTVIGPDHFIPYRIHLYNKHVFCAESEQEALTFLKTYGVTHLMLTKNDLIKQASVYSTLGSNETVNRQFRIVPLWLRTPENTKYRMEPTKKNIPLQRIDIDLDDTQTPTVTCFLENDKTANLPYTAFIGNKRIDVGTELEDVSKTNGGIVIFFDEKTRLRNGFYVTNRGWDSLAFRLYFRGLTNDVFVPVFQAEGSQQGDAKIWEIRMPSEVTPNPKYLEY